MAPCATSLSARRAWIEIRLTDMSDAWHRVALRKESVDRNNLSDIDDKFGGVALRKESVDRNHQVCQFACAGLLSLSARRAWIEISSSLDDILAGVSRSPQGERG